MIKEKILSLADADAWVAAQRASGRRIGFTCGSFDLLHAGHAQYLEEARNLCDVLLVAVNSDESIRRYKSVLRPVQAIAERQFLLAALASVDAVTTLEDDRPLELILRWKPDLYIKGGDYSPEKLRSAAAVSNYRGETVVIPARYPTSTSRVIERILTLSAHAEPTSPSAAGPRRIVFLDRDGTLIENVNFLHDPKRLRLHDGVTEGLRELSEAGFRLVIVTNQQGLGLGYFDMDAFIAVNQQLLKQIGAAGVSIDRIYFCPHSQADNCDCRKPLPGMIVRACRDFQARPEDCFLIGDTAADVAAGAAASVPAFQVVYPQADFLAAVAWIKEHATALS